MLVYQALKRLKIRVDLQPSIDWEEEESESRCSTPPDTFLQQETAFLSTELQEPFIEYEYYHDDEPISAADMGFYRNEVLWLNGESGLRSHGELAAVFMTVSFFTVGSGCLLTLSVWL
jgi:hypothetical protein